MTASEIRPILIVGAGPTGLAAAAVLSQLGLPFRIIDRGTSRSKESKAIGIQAGTLECLEAALGPKVVETLVQTGRPTREFSLHVDQRAPLRAKLDGIPSRYDFLLMLEQYETERILEEFVNAHSRQIERETTLVSLRNEHDHAVAVIQSRGKLEESPFSFVIGCDGAHSTVRHQMEIPFQGGAYTGDFILGDTQLRWPWDYGSLRVFLNERGVLACFPMKVEKRYRLILFLHDSPSMSGAEIGFEEFQAMVSRLSSGQIECHDPLWLTRFRLHHRMVKNFKKGRVFVAGDAAHIHSPVGAQGMNTGIQDVMNLVFKLDRVMKGAPLAILENYEKERKPVAQNVLRTTDAAFRFVLARENVFTKWARRNLLPRFFGQNWLRTQVLTAISEVRIARREIARFKS